MIRYIALCLMIFSVSFNLKSPVYPEGIKSPDLWSLAVKIADRNKNWIPGTIDSTSEEYDPAGNIKKVTELKMKIYRGVSNDMRSDVLKYIENGADLTEKRKMDQEESLKKDGDFNQVLNIGFGALIPFYPDEQTNLEYKSTGRSVTNDGNLYTVYEFKRKSTNNSFQQGEAWLDSASGAPLRISYIIKPLPKYVFSLTNEVFFKSEKGRWYIDRVRLDGIGGFFFNTIHMITTSVFDEYWHSKKLDNE